MFEGKFDVRVFARDALTQQLFKHTHTTRALELQLKRTRTRTCASCSASREICLMPAPLLHTTKVAVRVWRTFNLGILLPLPAPPNHDIVESCAPYVSDSLTAALPGIKIKCASSDLSWWWSSVCSQTFQRCRGRLYNILYIYTLACEWARALAHLYQFPFSLLLACSQLTNDDANKPTKGIATTLLCVGMRVRGFV